MDFNIKKPSHIIALITMLITLFFVFIFPILIFFGVLSSLTASQTLEIPENLRLFFEIITLTVQFIYVLGLFILIPFLWYALVNKLNLKGIYSRIKLTSENIDMAFLWGILSVIIIFVIFFALGLLLRAAGVDTSEFSNIPDIEKYISPTSVFLIAAIQPIAEEIFFRGFLLEKFESFAGQNMAIFSTAVLFGVAHMIYGKLYPAVFPIIIGIIFGYIVVKTKNLYASIIAHISFNVISVILYYFAKSFVV